jgi:acetyl esterase/lipase
MMHGLSIVILAAVLLMVHAAGAQETSEFVLWPDGAPGAKGKAAHDVPSLTIYRTANARAGGATVIICPGGGYQRLAPHEGRDYALFLNQRGLNCFVLKYRLAADGYRHPSMMQDGLRAIRYVRANAEKFQLDPKRVGIIGTSAGGHLASTVLTHFDAGDPAAVDPIERQSSRPDFGVLCYPVITMGPLSHAGSKKGLLGDDPSDELVKLLSNELQVSAQTPPCFIWHGLDDKSVPVENSLMFAEALKKQGVPFELHIYQSARHGIGLGDRNPPFTNALAWTGDLVQWLKGMKVLDDPSAPSTSLSPR